MTKVLCIAFSACILSLSALAKDSVTQPKVVGGDTIYSILKRYGFDDNQRKAALSQSSIPKDFTLIPGHIYRVIKDKARTELRFYDRDTAKAFSFWREKSNAGAKSVPIKYEVKYKTATGKIRGSVVENVSNAIGDDLVAYRFMDAFWLDYNVPRLLKKNAKFSLTVEKLYDHGRFVRFGEVTRAELEINGQLVVREFIPLKNGGVFYDLKQNHENRPFYAPVDYIRISSLFQPRRYHPIKKFRRAHEGVDFELSAGENIYSVSEGRVVRSGRNRAAGKFIVIRHNGGYESYYNHMSEVMSFPEGAKISAGTLVGKVGCTGYCTKPHLHFAVKKNGRFINPIQLIRGYSFAQRREIEKHYAHNSDSWW